MNPLASLESGDLRGIAATFGTLLAISAFLSGTETAFFSLQERDRRAMAEGRSWTERRVDGLLRHRAGLITTLLIGDETASVLFSAASAAFFAAMFPDKPWISVLVATPILVLFADITPKVLGWRYNRAWVRVAVWPLYAFYLLVTPFRWVFERIVAGLGRLFGVTEAAGETGLREEEFLVLVDKGAQQGTLDSDEQELIEAVFELDDLPIHRLMTPRPDIFAIDIDAPWEELLAACKEAQYSRVPIYRDDPDNVLGILLLKDLLRHRRRPLDPTALERILLPVVWMPATRPASEAMRHMIRNRLHLALVADEHGTWMGLIALDDLIVELVGELGEEEDGDDDRLERDASGGWTISGAIDLEELDAAIGWSIEHEEIHTLGGLVFHTMARVPRPGDRCDVDGWTIEVLQMAGRRIQLVRVVPPATEEVAP